MLGPFLDFPSDIRFPVRRRFIIVPIRQDPHTVAFGILELIVAQHPEEAAKAQQSEKQRHRDEDCKTGHDRPLRRMALRQTISELPDMAIAANRGVTSPAKATGTVMML